ncbi:MAG: hypothetical protein HY043_17060 [Verrucomicrobia bacterium]|nr:hypothetical protein [Verrucomicrobiota bacterium]
MSLDASYLFASLIWGSVGIGFWIYAKKQSSFIAFLGGILIIAVSYLVSSALLMSVICLGILALMYWLHRQGY